MVSPLMVPQPVFMSEMKANKFSKFKSTVIPVEHFRGDNELLEGN